MHWKTTIISALRCEWLLLSFICWRNKDSLLFLYLFRNISCSVKASAQSCFVVIYCILIILDSALSSSAHSKRHSNSLRAPQTFKPKALHVVMFESISACMAANAIDFSDELMDIYKKLHIQSNTHFGIRWKGNRYKYFSCFWFFRLFRLSMIVFFLSTIYLL